MALNQLYSDHKLALMREATSSNVGERLRHLGVAAGIARQIGEAQRQLGAQTKAAK